MCVEVLCCIFKCMICWIDSSQVDEIDHSKTFVLKHPVCVCPSNPVQMQSMHGVSSAYQRAYCFWNHDLNRSLPGKRTPRSTAVWTRPLSSFLFYPGPSHLDLCNQMSVLKISYYCKKNPHLYNIYLMGVDKESWSCSHVLGCYIPQTGGLCVSVASTLLSFL